MKAVGLVLFLVLTVIAGIHAYWGFGGLWPADSEDALIRTVIGDENFTAMPPLWMTLAVSAAIMGAALIALLGTARRTGILRLVAMTGSAVLALVFLGRGASGLAHGAGLWLTEITLTEPFASLDRTLYSPLCVAIGGGFVVLLVAQLRRS